MTSNYKFIQNDKCEYFPCHNTLPIKCHDVIDIKDFNCLFCYCPLYPYKDCGGQYKILKNGIKDCSNCLIPHDKNNYDLIINKIRKHL